MKSTKHKIQYNIWEVFIIQVLCIICKLAGLINLNWFLVFSPIWITCVGLICVFIMCIYIGNGYHIKNKIKQLFRRRKVSENEKESSIWSKK